MKSLLFIFAMVSLLSTSIQVPSSEKALEDHSETAPDPLDSFFQSVKPLQYKIPNLNCLPGKPCPEPAKECEDCSPLGEETATEEEEANEFSSFVRYGISLGGAFAALGAIYLFIKALNLPTFMGKPSAGLGV